MLPKIAKYETLPDYCLKISFDDGKNVIYDVKDDMVTLPGYNALSTVPGLFQCAQLDKSRTCIFWNSEIDLPSDTLYEFGVAV